MKYEYLEDVATADIAFKAQGETLEELFENCALATAETMADIKAIEEKHVEQLVLEEEDTEQLLYDFLAEIVYLKDAERLFFFKFKVELDGNKLTAKMFGDHVNKEMILNNDVKAVTMHKFKVWKEKNKYYATIILDI